MHFGPEILKSEGMLAVEITENDRQHTLTIIGGFRCAKTFLLSLKKLKAHGGAHMSINYPSAPETEPRLPCQSCNFSTHFL